LAQCFRELIAEVIDSLKYTSPTRVEQLVDLRPSLTRKCRVKEAEALGKNFRRNISDPAIRHLFELWHDLYQRQTARQAVDHALTSILSLEGIEDD
jgi:hypothetical protein